MSLAQSSFQRSRLVPRIHSLAKQKLTAHTDNEYRQDIGATYFRDLIGVFHNSSITVPLTYNDPGQGRNFINGTVSTTSVSIPSLILQTGCGRFVRVCSVPPRRITLVITILSGWTPTRKVSTAQIPLSGPPWWGTTTNTILVQILPSHGTSQVRPPSTTSFYSTDVMDV